MKINQTAAYTTTADSISSGSDCLANQLSQYNLIALVAAPACKVNSFLTPDKKEIRKC
ncbi:hypothetical protein [Phascolarctobacterium succinatutens]|uniref:hypothetical protein n=1 Tax=Phascolarctobacterium succinatutens TaxID=626940 RepID=UPI0027BAB2E8|nr:hypothetical protein [Phascolarctobacterium succinatutens]